MRYGSHKYYTVAIGNSTYISRTPAPDETCGHKHKTLKAAEKCQEKLIGYIAESGTCSAKWYNSYILGRVLESDQAESGIDNDIWDRI